MPYDVTKWKAQFSKYLNLPTSDLLYILGVTSNAGGLRRFYAREKAAWREQEEPKGTDGHANKSTGSLSHVGPLRKERQGETASKRDRTEGEELERDLVREASKKDLVGEALERDLVRQATGTVSIQLYILSGLADPWSYQTAVTFLKVSSCVCALCVCVCVCVCARARAHGPNVYATECKGMRALVSGRADTWIICVCSCLCICPSHILPPYDRVPLSLVSYEYMLYCVLSLIPCFADSRA